MPRPTPLFVAIMLLLLAVPAKANFPGWITACSRGPFGSSGCPAAEVGERMATLTLGAFDNFSALGMESYAMEDAIRRIGRAVVAKANGSGCGSHDDIIFAGAIWRTKVSLSPRADANEKALFDHLERIIENGATYATEGC